MSEAQATGNGQVGADLGARLEAYYARAMPERAPTIQGFGRLAAGWECEVFAFDLSDRAADAPRPLVLRLYSGPEARDKASREFAIMRYLQGVRYPVPHVYLLETDSTPLGRPFVIMDRVDGERLSPVLHLAPYQRKREFLTRFVRLLVDLHAVDWRPFAPELDAADLLSSYVQSMEVVVTRCPALGAAPVLAWLRAHAAAAGEPRPAIVHLDYHMENLLVRRDGSIAVLDWTQGQVQDCRADLAWTLLLQGMYDGWPMREALLGEYRRLSGWSVDGIEYFEVLAAARRLFSMLVVLGGDGASIGLDPRAAEQIQSNLGHFAGVYTLLLGRTGIAIPAAERALERWDGRR